jgi:hypothetical protein
VKERPRESRLELESLRKKLQRTTIENLGLSQVQLWKTSFRMLTITRCILPPAIPEQPVISQPPIVTEPAPPAPSASSTPAPTSSSSPLKAPAPVAVYKTLRILAPSITPDTESSVSDATASTGMTVPAPQLRQQNLFKNATENAGRNTTTPISTPPPFALTSARITEQNLVRNDTQQKRAYLKRVTPETLAKIELPLANGERAGEVVHSRTSSMKTEASSMDPLARDRDRAVSNVSTQSQRLASIKKNQFVYRDPACPGTLHGLLWEDIIPLTASAHGILSRNQQQAIIRYARDRTTLAKEHELQGKAESHQVWKTLEAMGCLAYEIRM